MNDKINTWITSSLIQYVKDQGGDVELLADGLDNSLEQLSQPGRFVPNEVLLIMFSQARQMISEPLLAHTVGIRMAKSVFADQMQQTISLYPDVETLKQTAGQWLRKLCPMVSVKIDTTSHHEMTVRITKKVDFLYSYDHCLLIRGFLEGLIEISGGMLDGLVEESCLVSVDNVGTIRGHKYRIDDDGNIWDRETDNTTVHGTEKLVSKMEKDNSHSIGNTMYCAKHCSYNIKWRDNRTLFEMVWARSGGRLIHFLNMIKIVAKSKALDPDSYRKITEEWKHWVTWESSLRLTKTKYLSSIGVLCLATLPIIGHFFGKISNEIHQTLLTSILSLFIIALGFLIIRIQLNYSRKLQRQLKDSQRFLHNAGVGVTIIKPNHEIEFANPLIVDIHGDVVGQKCYEVFKWRQNTCPNCPISNILNGTQNIQKEIQYYNKNGQPRWFHITSASIRDSNDNIKSTIQVSTDITHRKLLELELSKKQGELESSEDRYRNFMANAADAILITDPLHKIIEANNIVQKLIGAENSPQYLNKNIFETDLLPIEDKKNIQRLFQEMIEYRSPCSFETRLQCPDGRNIEIEARAIPIVNNGEVTCVQSIFRDVTERKQQDFEKTLLLSISNAIKDAPDIDTMVKQGLEGICAVMKVPIGTIFLREPNKDTLNLAAHVGISPEDIQKQSSLSIDYKSSLAGRTAYMKKTIVINNMNDIKAKPETKRFIVDSGVNAIASVPMLLDEEAQGVVYIVSKNPEYFNKKRLDVITQVANELAVGVAKQRLHDIVKKMNDELIHKNEELKNATLQSLQNEKMASIGQLAAGVAHEINNPMGYINSNLHLLNQYRKELETVFRGYKQLSSSMGNNINSNLNMHLQNIRTLEEDTDLEQIFLDLNDMISESIEGTERVNYIVKNLKEFSHIEASEPQMSNIHGCLENTLNIVKSELKYKADVSKDYGDIPSILCYPQELKQVFMNLLVNASQSIETKGEINIKTRINDGFVDIQIRDTGIGIPPEKLTKIFDPFYTTKEVGKGTGLGLSISYGIIKKHDGEIEVVSTPGKGSTFTVKLPAKGVGKKEQKCSASIEKVMSNDIGANSSI